MGCAAPIVTIFRSISTFSEVARTISKFSFRSKIFKNTLKQLSLHAELHGPVKRFFTLLYPFCEYLSVMDVPTYGLALLSILSIVLMLVAGMLYDDSLDLQYSTTLTR